VLAIITPKFLHSRHLKLTSFNLQCLALNQNLRYFLVRRVDNPSERLTRNLHLFRRLLLVQTLKVSKPDGLKFVNRQNNFL
jgi:hypothetical protein